jgi:hypothetical protein
MREYNYYGLEFLITVQPKTVMGPVFQHDPYKTQSLKQLFALLKHNSDFYTCIELSTRAVRVPDGCTRV